MSKIITCVVCGDDFDLHSEAKRKVGGLSTTCIDCSEETTVRYAGVQSSDGKQAQATILKFESNKDKDQYMKFWQNNSGLFKGKSCQMSKLTSTPKISFKTINKFIPTNHKGKQ